MHGSTFESSNSADSHTNFVLGQRRRRRRRRWVGAPKAARFYCRLWK